MKKIAIVAFIFVLCGCAKIQQKQSLTTESNAMLKGNAKAEKGTLQIDVHEKTLSNGLKILVVENKKLPVFSYYTYFKVGSKFESLGATGSSHLLEHMMFKGAKKYGEGEFDKIVSGKGGRNNAYTTNDLTVYYEALPREHFELIADVEADRMQNLLLAEKSFGKERNVVLEERKMRYENSDRGKLYLSMMNKMFEGTPYGTSVIGEVEDLQTVSREKVWNYFQKFYVPNNAIIVVVGDLDHEKVFKTVEKKFGEIKSNPDLISQKQEILNRKGFDFKKPLPDQLHLKGTSPLPMFMSSYRGIKIGEREGFVLDILSSVLGDGESSYLNKKFVLGKKPKASQIYAANMTLQESGVFFIGGKLLDKVNRNNFMRELQRSLNRSCSEALTERAVEKVKNQYLFAMVSELDTNSGIAQFIGNREVYYGDYNFYKKEMEIYDSITIEELKTACNKYLKNQPALNLSIWNKN